MKKDIRYIPFPQFCHKCKYREPTEEFTSFNDPDTVYEIGCENKEICANAINLHGMMMAEVEKIIRSDDE